jgi:hypothetical protein
MHLLSKRIDQMLVSTHRNTNHHLLMQKYLVNLLNFYVFLKFIQLYMLIMLLGSTCLTNFIYTLY